MYLLAEMLAYKHHYYTNKVDYDEYAFILACDTFQRMIDTTKTPIKSVLNYMKSIMYFRKTAFDSQRYQEAIDIDSED